MPNNLTYPLIKTRRLILRLPEPKDASVLLEFECAQASYLAPWEPLKPDGYFTKTFWENSIQNQRRDFELGTSCCLVVLDKQFDRYLGKVNFNHIIRGAFQSCFLGFKVAEENQRQGLMTEALLAAIPYVFETLNLHRISANVMPKNKASLRVLEKCGFNQEGVAPNYLRINGKWEDHVLLSVLNNNWKG